MGYPWAPGQVLTAADLNAAFSAIPATPVRSFNTRTGAITLTTGDVTAALGYTPVQSVAGRTGAVTLTTSDLNDWSSAIAPLAPLNSPHFVGTPIALTAAPGTNTTQLATTAFVNAAVSAAGSSAVSSVAGRTGAVTLTHSDLTDWTSATATFLTTAPVSSVAGRTGIVTLTHADLTDWSTALASAPPIGSTAASTGAFTTLSASSTVSGAGITALLAPYAPLASPVFTGAPTVPGYLTTASAAGTYAPLASPTFTGSPTVPGYLTTATAASTYAPLASPTFTGSPTVPGYLTTATAASTYAPLASPALSGTPTAPTATAGTNTGQLATTAFVAAAVTASTTGVASFNTRTGAITLSSSDVTTALTYTPYNATNPSGYQTAANVTATLATPPAIGGSAANTGAFTTLTATTPSATDSSTTAATTAMVQARIASTAAISSTGGSTTLTASQYNTAALLVTGTLTSNATLVVPNTGCWIVTNGTSGAFTLTVKTSAGTGVTVTQGYANVVLANGTNVVYADNDLSYGPTIAGGTINSTSIGATTASTGAFSSLSASSTVSGTGFATLLAPYAPLASPTFTGTVTIPSGASISGYAPLASPTFTGTPSLPTGTTAVTQTAGTSNTTVATTAFVATATAGSGAGGGASSTPGTSQTLTSASSRAQSYAFTAAGLTVTLPDATTLSAGGPIFSLYNAGSYSFGVLRNGGSLLTAVPPGASADCYLDSNGTAAGTWHATGQGLQGAFELVSNTLSGAVVTATTTLLGSIGTVAIYFGGSSASTSVQAYDTSGNTVGSVATLTSAATSPVLLAIDSTHGLVVYYGSSNICAQVLTLTGTTIAVGTQATVATGTPTALAAAVTLTTGSSYLVGYNVSAGSYAVQVGVSGTTVTFGTAVSSGPITSWAATRPFSVISSTQVFGVAATTNSAVRVIGISGSTVTMNTGATASTAPTIVLMLSTTLFLLIEGTTGLQAVSVSGTTCTTGTQSTSFGSTAWTAGQWAASGTSFILGNAASPGVLYYGTISGTTITLAASLTTANIWSTGQSSASSQLSNNTPFAVSSGYIYAQQLGVLTASGSAFSLAQPDLWPDQMAPAGGVALQDGSGGVMMPVAAGDGFVSLAVAQASGNLLVKPGRVYPVGGYTAALSGAISAGKFLVGTTYPGRTAPTGTGAQWRVGVWQLAS